LWLRKLADEIRSFSASCLFLQQIAFMIQRIQSIWLLLATVFAALTFVLPFSIGLIIVNAKTTTWLTILAAFTGVMAFVDIFLFSNRKQQLRICLLGILLTIIYLGVCFAEMSKDNGTLALSCLIYFAILGFYIMAANGIRKDEKLIKSMDRLR
jgi:FtsH-binding integral membrane protein